jgi:hypothetical protein
MGSVRRVDVGGMIDYALNRANFGSPPSREQSAVWFEEMGIRGGCAIRVLTRFPPAVFPRSTPRVEPPVDRYSAIGAPAHSTRSPRAQ